MAFDITDWNVDPNQRWFVKLIDVGAIATIELYNSASDAQGGVNKVAHASDLSFGADVKVLLIADAVSPAYGLPLAKFNTALDYHLKFTGNDGDPTKIFQIGPFTDLDAIEDALMLTKQVIQDRATVEINKGTHTRVVRSLRLDGHYPALNEGDCITFISSKRGVNALRNRVTALTTEISIGDNREVLFFDQLELIEYQDFTRT